MWLSLEILVFFRMIILKTAVTMDVLVDILWLCGTWFPSWKRHLHTFATRLEHSFPPWCSYHIPIGLNTSHGPRTAGAGGETHRTAGVPSAATHPGASNPAGAGLQRCWSSRNDIKGGAETSWNFNLNVKVTSKNNTTGRSWWLLKDDVHNSDWLCDSNIAWVYFLSRHTTKL